MKTKATNETTAAAHGDHRRANLQEAVELFFETADASEVKRRRYSEVS